MTKRGKVRRVKRRAKVIFTKMVRWKAYMIWGVSGPGVIIDAPNMSAAKKVFKEKYPHVRISHIESYTPSIL